MKTPGMNDHDIRELLDDAVADVEPRRGLSDITARTGRGRRSWVWGTAGAVVATAAVIAAVSLVGNLPGTSDTDGGDVAAQGGRAHQAKPEQRDDANHDKAPLFIGSPADGATVSSPFAVSGKATAFEGNVQWELKQGATVVRRGFTTAEVCCTLSPYSFKVSAPPGTYTLVVHDEDVGEGPPPAHDTVQVTVQ
jgi:hypothetical protein